MSPSVDLQLFLSKFNCLAIYGQLYYYHRLQKWKLRLKVYVLRNDIKFAFVNLRVHDFVKLFLFPTSL